MKNVKMIFMIIIVAVTTIHADVKIVQSQGKVLVRYGLEESWQEAKIGTILKNIDTILSAENGYVVLELEDGMRFDLGANAILDIADIRQIQERELFMYLMSQKIDKLEPADENKKIRVGNVSIVHGQAKKGQKTEDLNADKEDWYPFEVNGAMALYNNQYYPNTIIKFIKIQNKYGAERDLGKIDYFIGKSFEKLDDSDQARDAYQRALDEVKKVDAPDQKWVDDAREALRRLNQQ
jgi:hypothetical protein